MRVRRRSKARGTVTVRRDREQRIHRALTILVLFVGYLMAPALAAAATQADISIGPPDGLLGGPVFLEPAGTYEQVADVHGDQISADLTFQLSPPGTMAEPGPVVVFWQLRVDVTDVQFADGASRLVALPNVETVLPDCEASGDCTVRVPVSGPITPAVEAAELEWVRTTRLTVAVTLVRTFEGGSLLQLVTPVPEGNGGTFASPTKVSGPLLASGVLDAEVASPAEIRGPEFHLGGPMYDWAPVLERAVADFPHESPQPAPKEGGLDQELLLVVIAMLVGVLAGGGSVLLIQRWRAGKAKARESP